MNNIIRTIGENIKRLREQSGLTQSIIANYLNVDQSFISKVEKGERSITSDTLERLANLFGVSTEDLSDNSNSTKCISFALRANQISQNDLEVISAINKIALNANFLSHLLGSKDHG